MDTKVRDVLRAFYQKYKYAHEWTVEMDADYTKAMKFVLRNKFKLHGGEKDILDECCCVTNHNGWERFVENTEERRATIEDIIEELISQIFWSEFSKGSDTGYGMTWDGFLKCQWLYQRIKKRMADGEYRFNNGVAV